MKWEYEDIIESLQNDYVLHYKNRQHYLENDNEVDADWEGAVCDYIFDKLQEITGGTPTDVADVLQDMIDGVFVFNPQDHIELLKQYIGKSFYAAQDIYYCSYFDLLGSYDEEDVSIMLEEIFSVSHIDNEDMVYIPKGTKMTLISVGDPKASGWPTFEIHGEEFDFAGDPFKLKKSI